MQRAMNEYRSQSPTNPSSMCDSLLSTYHHALLRNDIFGSLWHGSPRPPAAAPVAVSWLRITGVSAMHCTPRGDGSVRCSTVEIWLRAWIDAFVQTLLLSSSSTSFAASDLFWLFALPHICGDYVVYDVSAAPVFFSVRAGHPLVRIRRLFMQA